MIRRRSDAVQDPTEARATAAALIEALRDVLETVSAREQGLLAMRFGLRDGVPKTYDELGQMYGVSRDRIRQLESTVMSKMRHPSRSQQLHDFRFEELATVPPHIRARILGHPDQQSQLIFCERHGWYEVFPGRSHGTCGHCPCPLRMSWGRPAKYCDDACKQAAYRRRKARGGASRKTT